MTNLATQPRIAARSSKGLIFAALILPFGIASVPALAGANIQMLPPVTEATKLAPYPTPCPPGGSPNILTWDGTNPISCTTGVTVTNGNVGIGTTIPNTSLDLSQKTDAISMPSGTTVQEPRSHVKGMTRYNTDTNKLEYWNGTEWVGLATSHPQITTATAPWPPGVPFNARGQAQFVDCVPTPSMPSPTAIGCTSIESPSGQWSCDTLITTDPYTGYSACETAGCQQGSSTDSGYYTSVSCIQF